MDKKDKLKIIAIILARGGSKGIPRKNVRIIASKPLIAHTIEQAREAQGVNRIFVSTDDQEIARISKQYGAEIIWRPAELGSDNASSESALIHALNYLKDTEKYEPDLVVFLQCTSPIRFPADIEQAIKTLLDQDADSLVSVTRWHGLNWIIENGEAKSVTFDFTHRPRRQDMREEFRENGSIFIFKPWVLEQTGNRLGGKIALFEMDPLTRFETDTLEDFFLCGLIMNHKDIFLDKIKK